MKEIVLGIQKSKSVFQVLLHVTSVTLFHFFLTLIGNDFRI